MKLFAQILLIALCAYAAAGISVSGIVSSAQSAADSVVNVADNVAQDAVSATDDAVKTGENVASSIIDKIDSILHPKSNSSDVSAVDTCYSNYNTQLGSINTETVSQSQGCYAVAQDSSADIVESVNSSYSEAVKLSQSIQAQLAVCDAEASETEAFSCYVATFDANLKNLDELAIQSQLALAYMDGYQSEIDITKNGCVSAVILSSKANSTIALNTLESCLDTASSAASSSASSSSSGSSASSV